MSSKLPALRLTQKQQDFVAYLAQGLHPAEACRLAGFASAQTEYNRLLRAPAVLYALELELRRVLHGQMAPIALNVLFHLVKEGDSDRVRLDAARLILDRAGFVPPKQQVSQGEREPEHMSTQELHELVARLERELGERSAPVAAQVIDNT